MNNGIPRLETRRIPRERGLAQGMVNGFVLSTLILVVLAMAFGAGYHAGGRRVPPVVQATVYEVTDQGCQQLRQAAELLVKQPTSTKAWAVMKNAAREGR